MGRWLNAVAISAADDFAAVGEAIGHFDALYEATRGCLDVAGRPLVAVSAAIPSLTDTIYVAWSELRAICQILDLRRTVALGAARKRYIEHYNRELSVAQVESYAKVDPQVVAVGELQLQTQYVLDKWEGLSKGLERLSFQVRLIGEMRRAGMDDTVV